MNSYRTHQTFQKDLRLMLMETLGGQIGCTTTASPPLGSHFPPKNQSRGGTRASPSASARRRRSAGSRRTAFACRQAGEALHLAAFGKFAKYRQMTLLLIFGGSVLGCMEADFCKETLEFAAFFKLHKINALLARPTFAPSFRWDFLDAHLGFRLLHRYKLNIFTKLR